MQMSTMLSSEVWQDIQGIRACCVGRYKTAGNCIWKFNK